MQDYGTVLLLRVYVCTSVGGSTGNQREKEGPPLMYMQDYGTILRVFFTIHDPTTKDR
jgi:hypothetical protein